MITIFICSFLLEPRTRTNIRIFFHIFFQLANVHCSTRAELSFAFAFTGDVSKWDTSSVTDMSFLFAFAYAFIGDVSKWNVGSVTNMDSSKSNSKH